MPLAVARGGFYDSAEILDLLSLLQLLDNPLQDVPCIAVLRSPLVGLSLDELAANPAGGEGEAFLDGAESGVRSQKSVVRMKQPRKPQNFWNGFRAGGNWRGNIRFRNAWRRCWRKRFTPTGCGRSRAARSGARTLNGF